MKKNYHSNIDISIWIENKYNNNIFPELPKALRKYIIDNPELLDIYMNKDINLDKILDYLALEYKEKKDIDLVKTVTYYIEHEFKS